MAHILDHAGTLVFAEVNVDIGQADAFDIQEAFENEIVGQGIKVCDTQSPRDDRTGRGTTTGTDRDVVPLRPVDEVLHDQKIPRKAHLADDLQFHFETIPINFGINRVPIGVQFQALFEAFTRKALELRRQGHPFRKFVYGEVVMREVHLHMAFFSYADRIGKGFGNMLERLFHLLSGFVIEIPRFKTHPFCVIDFCLRLNTQQDVMGLNVVRVQVMAVVRRNQRNFGMLRKLQQLIVQSRLIRQCIGLDFQIETPIVDIHVLLRLPDGVVKCPAVRDQLVGSHQRAGDFTGKARGKRNEPFAVLAEQGFIHAGLIMEAVQEALGDKTNKVMVPLVVLRQQNQMVPDTGEFGILIPVILGNVDFAPDDGFDAVTLACRIEISRAVQVAVIGNRGGRHPEIFGACA